MEDLWYSVREETTPEQGSLRKKEKKPAAPKDDPFKLKKKSRSSKDKQKSKATTSDKVDAIPDEDPFGVGAQFGSLRGKYHSFLSYQYDA
jgi:hypothetical protein